MLKLRGASIGVLSFLAVGIFLHYLLTSREQLQQQQEYTQASTSIPTPNQDGHSPKISSSPLPPTRDSYAAMLSDYALNIPKKVVNAAVGGDFPWRSSLNSHHHHHQVTSSSSSSSITYAPGFEKGLPSCRITDLLEDPLTKEYGQNNIRLSRTYEGSGNRIRKLLKKALQGKPIKIAVVGGSVSAGHAVPSPWTAEGYMYKRIQQWFIDTFPDAEHTLNTDSAVPAVTAWYFSYCVMATLPQDADLIFLELDINQWPPEQPGVMENNERLFRSLLDLPSKPALIYLSVFGMVFSDMTHGWRASTLLSQWLDVPEISIRNWYLPHLMQHPAEVPYLFTNKHGGPDLRHMNAKGHRAMGDMTIAYLREQLCLVQREAPYELEPNEKHWPDNSITEQLPRLGMLWKWSENASIPALHPRCDTVTSKTAPLKPISMKGWELVNRNDKKSYEATEVGSEITFKTNVALGEVGLFVWKTPFEGFGEIICWIDDDKREDHKKIAKAFTPSRSAATFEHTGSMFKDVSPGDHTLTCRLKESKDGGTTFRISALVTR